MYAHLVPADVVSERVKANVRALAPSFLSLHIRRTDHWGGTGSSGRLLEAETSAASPRLA